jgi:hypothetical protein
MNKEPVTPDSQQANQWKQIFETAVDELGGNSDAAQRARKMPIAQRLRIARPPADPLTDQKRALSDAATALAALWKSEAQRKNRTAADTTAPRRRVQPVY